MVRHKHAEQLAVTFNQQAKYAQKVLGNTEMLSDFCKPGSNFRMAASALEKARGGPVCGVIEKQTARVLALRKRREFTESESEIPKQTIEWLFDSFLNRNTHFMPGTVHPDFRLHPDDRTTIRTFERLCRWIAPCITDETELFRSDGFKGNFICAGGPYSNLLCRLVMQYSRKVPGDPKQGLVRCRDPLFVLPYTFMCDPWLLEHKGVPEVKGVDSESNWSIEGPNDELLYPDPGPDKLIATDYFMALLLPNIFDLESYERGDRIVMFGGCHGPGTRTINKFLLNDEFLQKQLLRLFTQESHACQLVLKVSRIDHSRERPEPLEISRATEDIRAAEIDLDLNLKLRERWLSCLPNANRNKITHGNSWLNVLECDSYRDDSEPRRKEDDLSKEREPIQEGVETAESQPLKRIKDSVEQIVWSNSSDEEKVDDLNKAALLIQQQSQALQQKKEKMFLHLPKPGENYPLYPGRTDALRWLEKHWGRFLKHFKPDLDRDYLYQDQLGKRDPKLLRAVIDQVAYKKKRGEFSKETTLSEFVPPKKKRIDLEIESVSAGVRTEDIKEIHRIGAAIKRRQAIFQKR
jgi:hypothetical protein